MLRRVEQPLWVAPAGQQLLLWFNIHSKSISRVDKSCSKWPTLFAGWWAGRVSVAAWLAISPSNITHTHPRIYTRQTKTPPHQNSINHVEEKSRPSLVHARPAPAMLWLNWPPLSSARLNISSFFMSYRNKYRRDIQIKNKTPNLHVFIVWPKLYVWGEKIKIK